MSTMCESCKSRYECNDINRFIMLNPDDTCYGYERDLFVSPNLKNGPVVPSTILKATMDAANAAFGLHMQPKPKFPKIKNVIFNDPATIVFWEDGTKTIVKCQDGDVFDPEKGLTMAISKKALGNKGNYCNEIKKWLPEEKDDADINECVFHIPDPAPDYIVDAIENVKKAAERFWTSF